MLEKIMPELPLDDVAAGVSHYRDVLGFSVNYEQNDIGVIDRDSVRILLIARTKRHQGIGSCYVYVGDADALYAELVARGANAQGTPIASLGACASFRSWTQKEIGLHLVNPLIDGT